jgi:biotin carboxyl carrier protein
MALPQTSCPRKIIPFLLPILLVSVVSSWAQNQAGVSPSPAPATQQPVEAASATPPTNAGQQPASQKTDINTQIVAALDRLKAEGKLTSRRAVAAAVRKVINDNSIQHEIPAPLGAKVIAVHKHPGDAVHVGDKIITLLVNGKEVPVLAKQDGIMQAINVSKGGVIGNSRPRAAKAGSAVHSGSILLILKPLHHA